MTDLKILDDAVRASVATFGVRGIKARWFAQEVRDAYKVLWRQRAEEQSRRFPIREFSVPLYAPSLMILDALCGPHGRCDQGAIR